MAHHRISNLQRVAVLLLALAPVICLAQAPAPAMQQNPGQSLLPAAAGQTAAPAAPGVASAAVAAPTGYVLSANDSVGVEVFGEEDLKVAGRLNGEGNISLPLLGSVRLSGLTLSQATARVTELYSRDYLINPRVNVMLLGYAKRRFTVLGQISRPGSYEMPETSPGGIDLLEAIAMAGGYTRIAAPERVSVRRRGGEGGQDQVLRVNAKRLERGDSSAGNFRVMPGDTITVGESLF